MLKIITIFETSNQCLYAIKYPDKDSDEFDLLFSNWQDPEFLDVFFSSNLEELKKGFFDYRDVEGAINTTME